MAHHKTLVDASNVYNPYPDIFPHAVKAGGLVFVSGSIGIDEHGKLVEGTIQDRTHQIIKNFTRVLEAAGSSRDKIVKINVFITDMDNFFAMNEVYQQYFKRPNLPCRTCVAVKTLPLLTDVEIECTALQ